ncbi:MAG: signal peptidase II [Gammaproteobacteria bacterium]|nr:signal peptidase II [Gammaproteobacteria bacterium]|tara:strand:- start:5079 stop:5567 length:489 start_codon:yes stop_codon:yes gene_type:complete
MVNKEALYNLRFIILIILLVTIDLVSKSFAINNLSFGESSTTLLPFIKLLLIYNSGIAFGIFGNGGMLASNILLLITLLISSYLIWMIINETQKNKKYSLSIITAGALGNIIDRVIDGQVTDFLHLEILNFSFFVFNLADAFITIGAILIIYFEIIYRPKND